MDERQVAFEPPQVEVVVQPHHQQRGVDVARDDGAGHFLAAVVQAPGQLRQRRQPLMDEGVAAGRAGHGQHPVAGGDLVAGGGQFVPQRGQHPGTVFSHAVVERDRVAVHLADAQQLQSVLQAGRDSFEDRGVQADGRQPRESFFGCHVGCVMQCMPRRARASGRTKAFAGRPARVAQDVAFRGGVGGATAARAVGRARPKAGAASDERGADEGRQGGNVSCVHGGLLR